MFGWLYSLLGWITGYFAQKEGKLIFLGLDNAGKTTLFGFLSQGRVQVHQPTQRPTADQLEIYGVKFHAQDVGGHTEARATWREAMLDVTAIVFMIDATERIPARIQEAKTILSDLLVDPEYANIPILVFGNKIDWASKNPMNENEFRQAYGLELTTGKNARKSDLEGRRPIEVFMCSVLLKSNLQQGLQWIAAQM